MRAEGLEQDVSVRPLHMARQKAYGQIKNKCSMNVVNASISSWTQVQVLQLNSAEFLSMNIQ